MNQSKETFTFSSEPELMKVLVTYANAKDITKSQAIRKAIRLMLEHESK